MAKASKRTPLKPLTTFQRVAGSFVAIMLVGLIMYLIGIGLSAIGITITAPADSYGRSSSPIGLLSMIDDPLWFFMFFGWLASSVAVIVFFVKPEQKPPSTRKK